jgi:non-ribosomal peptide synthetase component E (peptide arylation enzyme)
MLFHLMMLQQLRRHGDIIQRTVGGYYIVQGRADDTMNLGGIKVGPPLFNASVPCYILNKPDIFVLICVCRQALWR